MKLLELCFLDGRTSVTHHTTASTTERAPTMQDGLFLGARRWHVGDVHAWAVATFLLLLRVPP